MKPKSSAFISLRYKNFSILWWGLLISTIGTQMQVTAINWHIYLLTKSTISLGLVGLANFLPLIIFSPLAGIAADLYNRKRIVFLAQAMMTLCAFFLGFFTLTKIISPLLIYLLVSLNSVAIVFDSSSRQSLYPLMVPKKYLANAASLINLMWRTSTVVGPSIGGLILAGFGKVEIIYFVKAVSFLAILIALFFIKPRRQVYQENISLSLSSIKEGFTFVFRRPLISSTMVLDFFASFFASANVLLPVFAKDILKVGAQGYGFLCAASSVGGVVAGLIFSLFSQIKKQGKLILTTVFIYGLATIVFGLSKSFYLSFFCLAVAGFCDVISTVIRATIRQLLTPDQIRGRMTAVNAMFYFGGPYLGEFEAGFLASLVGSPISVVIGGLGTVITTLFINHRVPQLRKYDNHSHSRS